MSQPHWALAAAVVAALDSRDLPQTLATLLRQIAPFAYTVVFGYDGTAWSLDL